MQQLYIMCGIPFSGKSVLSKKLAQKLGLFRVDLDEVKSDLLGKVTDESVGQKQWDLIYTEMYRRIEKALSEGQTVIQDAGNFTSYERGLVRNIADKMGITTIVIYIDLPESISRARWEANKETKERFHISEESLLSAITEMEPPLSEEIHIRYSDEPIDEWIQRNFSRTNEVEENA